MRRGAILVTVGGLILLGAAIGAIVSQDDEPGVELEPNSVAVIDPASGEIEDAVPVGARPDEISAGEGAIWVANLDDESVSQIAPADRAVVGTTGTGGAINGMAAGEGGVWVADSRRGVVSKIDPRFREVVERTRISPASLFAGADGPIAAGGGSIWVADGGSAIARLDPTRARLIDRTNVGNSPVGLALGETDLWVADDVDNTVSRIGADAATVTRTTPVGPGATAVAAGEDAVWVTESLADRVARIDPETGAVTDTIEVGRRPTAIAVGEGSVWVANSVSGTLSRIDPDSREVDLSVDLGQSPQDVAVAEGRVWATLNETVAAPAPNGDDDDDTMRILLNTDEVDLDTAANIEDPSRVHATCSTLYNYPDAPAPAGSTLEPEIAAGLPDVSDDGRTYTFTIAPGYAFSPPSNESVTAASFERAIERALTPEVGSFGGALIGDIVGAKAFSRDPSRGIAGVSADQDRLVIRLAAPSPDFPARLSTGWFCPVPVDTPAVPRGSAVIPSAGPYYVAEYTPERRIVLRRNPNYEGPRPGEIAEIEYELGVPADEAIARVEDGDADLYANGLNNLIPPEEVTRLDRVYGAHSQAADAGGQRLFIAPQLTTYFLLLNGSNPPFDDPRVRRAVNFAVDRSAIASVPFPGTAARPADQILPPGLPGFADQAIYPLGGPDLGRARQLAGPLDVRAVLYVCDLPECLELGETVRNNLEPIGIELEVRGFPVPEMFERIHTPGEPFDLALYNWIADYPDPYDFINLALQEDIGFANPELFDGVIAGTEFEGRIDRAATLTGDERYRTYAELDRDLTKEAAPIVPYASGTTVSLFSERIGCQVQQPTHGIILGRLCVR